eukprot:6213322-Pleurochrysis_carterae.AAC.3
MEAAVQQQASYSQSARLHRENRGKESSGSRRLPNFTEQPLPPRCARGGSTKATTVRPGRSRRCHIKYNLSRVGSKRGRGGWGAPARLLRVGGAQARFAMGSTGTPDDSESGTRARRKYACDANAIWETVHVSITLQMKGARDDSL